MPNPSTAHSTATALADQGYDVAYSSTLNADRTFTVELTATKGDEMAVVSSTDHSATAATLDALDKLQPLVSHA